MEAWEIWNEILDRARADGAALSPVERTIYLANCFLCDAQGGMSGFLYNVSPTSGRTWSRLRETADAIDAVGQPACASLLRALAQRLEELPEGAPTWGEFLAPLEEHLQVEVDPTIDGLMNDLYARLEAFTAVHFGTT